MLIYIRFLNLISVTKDKPIKSLVRSIFSLFYLLMTWANERSTHTSTNLKLKAADSQINFPGKSSNLILCLQRKIEEVRTSPSPHAYFIQ